MDQGAYLREAAEDTLRREADARRFLYEDVVELLHAGFLTQRFEIDGIPIVLRSLNSHEVGDLILRGSQGTDIDWIRHHISASVYMVNGFVVEPQYGSNQAWHVYQEWVRHLHYEQALVIYVYVTSLRNRVGRAIKVTDAYCHERYSRSRWRMNGAPSGHWNIVQQLWVSFNEAEDNYDRDLRQWQHTRSIVGSMSGKGSKSLKESEDKWREKKASETRRVIEKAVNWVISGERSEQKPLVVSFGGQTYEVPKVHAAQTVEEMEAEMMRAVRGEKDYHDLMMDQYKEFHRKRLEEARQKQQAAREAAWGSQEESGLRGETRLVGYTPDQLSKINPDMLQKNPNLHQASSSPEQDRFNQYLDTGVEVGWIGLKGTPEKAASADTRKSGESLQDRISRRAPTLKQ